MIPTQPPRPRLERLFATLLLGLSLTLFSLPGTSSAQDETKSNLESTLDEIWGLATLYENDDTFIKKISFVGRYHGQYTSSRSEGNGIAQRGGNFWNHRRWRAGVKMALGENLTFTNTYNLDTSPNFNGNRFIRSVEDMTVKWEPNDDVYLILGKQKSNVTREWTESSKTILTFERSPIVNNVISDKLWGLVVGFEAFGIAHELGGFANAYENDWRWPAFDEIDPVFVYNATIPVCESTSLHFDYQYADSNYSGGETFAASPYEHVVAVGTESDWGRFDLLVDVISAYNRGDARLGPNDDSHGLVILPSFDLTEKLQFVTKYSYASDARITHPQRFAGGFNAQFRPSVDNLHTYYAGFNYRVYGDKLKFMAGFEHADASRIVGTNDDYNNDTWLFGVRTYW